jgi:hypothetical protein
MIFILQGCEEQSRMNRLMELWNRRRCVRALQFVAKSELANGWDGVGAGSVDVVAPANTVLIFRESGSWQPTGGNPLRFNNVFRWSQIDMDLIRLEHLRFGEDHPVLLFDMAPVRESEWAEVSPHLCGQDCYAAALRLQASGLEFRWMVTGPKKQECIEYWYWW